MFVPTSYAAATKFPKLPNQPLFCCSIYVFCPGVSFCGCQIAAAAGPAATEHQLYTQGSTLCNLHHADKFYLFCGKRVLSIVPAAVSPIQARGNAAGCYNEAMEHGAYGMPTMGLDNSVMPSAVFY